MRVGILEEVDSFPRIVEWTIPDFFGLSKQIGYAVHSPNFRLWGWRCVLVAQPNGTESLPGKVVVLLHGIGKVGILQWELEIRRTDEKVLRKSGGWKEDGDEVEMNMFVPYTEIQKGCYTSGCLKVRCTLYCEETFRYLENEKITHTGSQTEAVTRADKLSSDLEELFNRGNDSDVTIRVEGKEFKLHKNILGARTPVFTSMFRHQMSENISGVVDIDDCDAVTFEEFLRYLYIGRVDKLSQNIVFSLHKVSDKYQVNELKAYCLEYIKNNLSVESFFDAIVLSAQHDEEELMDMATKFLSENLEKITVREDWQMFVSGNHLESNTLLTEALKIKEARKGFVEKSQKIEEEFYSSNPSYFTELKNRLFSIFAFPFSKTRDS